MPILVTDCPHCNASTMAFSFRHAYKKPNQTAIHYVTGSCNACFRPISASIEHRHGSNWSPENTEGDLLSKSDLMVNSIWPSRERIKAPDSVPPNVARNYIEAVDARGRSSWNAACGMYRRTMELALKAFAPDIEAWKLEKRIDKLAAEHRITQDIQSWAHELRLDGNEALHGDEEATEQMTDQMHYLTHFLLVYLYSLPQQIVKARERRE